MIKIALTRITIMFMRRKERDYNPQDNDINLQEGDQDNPYQDNDNDQ